MVVALSPTARRVKTPSWLDLRLVLGAVLVLGSVLLGATVVSNAQATSPFVTVRRDLAAGTVLSAGDLAVVQVQLDEATRRRYETDVADLVGRELNEAMSAGELVRRSATRVAPALTKLSIPFDEDYAPSLRSGQRVQLWLSTPDCPSVVLLPDVTVQGVRDGGSGFSDNGAQTIDVAVSSDLADRVTLALSMEDGHVRAGVLTGGTRGASGVLPDLSSCAGASGR